MTLKQILEDNGVEIHFYPPAFSRTTFHYKDKKCEFPRKQNGENIKDAGVALIEVNKILEFIDKEKEIKYINILKNNNK